MNSPIERAVRTVLLVEDDAAIRASLSDILSDEGYHVLTARNGREGIHMLTSTREEVSVILLDLMMPVMDGFAFRREQLLDPAIAGIPVIVLSADGRVSTKASTMGANAALQKPIHLDEMLDAVVRFCG